MTIPANTDPADQQQTPPADAGAPPVPTPPPADEANERGGGNSEAAARRRELREVQAERDTLRAGLDAAQRQIVEQMVGLDVDNPQVLHRLADLWEVGQINVADLRGDDGAIDPEKAAAAIANFQAERPYLFTKRQDPGERYFLAHMMKHLEMKTLPGETSGAVAAVGKLVGNPHAASQNNV